MCWGAESAAGPVRGAGAECHPRFPAPGPPGPVSDHPQPQTHSPCRPVYANQVTGAGCCSWPHHPAGAVGLGVPPPCDRPGYTHCLPPGHTEATLRSQHLGLRATQHKYTDISRATDAWVTSNLLNLAVDKDQVGGRCQELNLSTSHFTPAKRRGRHWRPVAYDPLRLLLKPEQGRLCSRPKLSAAQPESPSPPPPGRLPSSLHDPGGLCPHEVLKHELH